MSEPIILPHGGYKNLITYQKSDIIFQGTCIFVKRFLKAGDRTIDQMVQAARSGKQNIIEGSQASATSKEIELNLTNIAKASLEELLEDYLDYLKIRNLSEWSKDSETGLVARQVGREGVWDKFRPYIEQESNEVAANFMISEIRQCAYLLSRQIAYLEDDFKKHGGIKERMYTARREARGDVWSKVAYSYLAKVNTSAELEIRLSEMISELRQMTGHLKKRNG